jgi:hypothetical protein
MSVQPNPGWQLKQEIQEIRNRSPPTSLELDALETRGILREEEYLPHPGKRFSRESAVHI